MKSFIKIFLAFVFCSIAVSGVFADVNYINISAISKDEELTAQFKNIKDNLPFYAAWTNVWNYDVPKTTVAAQLKEFYKSFLEFSKKEKNNGELFLLLGDIAHYLYNLDAGDKNTNYNKMASDNYDKAIKLLPQGDYRGYWFLGVHNSGIPGEYLIKAIDNFKHAEQIAQGKKMPEDFWGYYAFAAALNAMPSHYLYAMDKAPGIKPLYSKDKMIKSIDKNIQHEKQEIWTVVKKDGNNFFISRPLGMRFYLSEEEGEEYGVSISDYRNNIGVVMIMPPNLKDKEGREIDYSITIIVDASSDNKSLKDALANSPYFSRFKNKKEIKLFNKYDKMVSCELIDTDDVPAYDHLGGAHFYLTIIERDKPKYPGLFVEMPNAPMFEETAYFVLQPQNDRFDGKLYYTILLNTAEAIHEEGLKVFKDFFENKLVIE